MIRFETANSNYIIDIEQKRYMRLSKSGIRIPESHRLVDGTWHPLREWRVEEYEGQKVLRLWRVDSHAGIITTPIVDIVACEEEEYDEVLPLAAALQNPIIMEAVKVTKGGDRSKVVRRFRNKNQNLTGAK